MNTKEFPHELFVEVSDQDFYLGRLTVNLLRSGHTVEISIVQRESKKILKHVDTLFDIEEYSEAVDRGVQKLSHFLKQKNQ